MKARLLYCLLICCVMSLLCCCSEHDNHAAYEIADTRNNLPIKICLLDWDVYGSFSLQEDSLMGDSIIRHPKRWTEMYVADSGQQQYRYNGLFHPKYAQLDLKEVYGIEQSDTIHPLQDRITYLHCEIRTGKDMALYVEVKKAMKCIQFLNGDTLHRREIQSLNIYPLHLQKGSNDYIVKAMMTGDDYSFEATLYDSISVARLYADGQSCNIIYPQIDSTNHVALLTNAHQNLMNTPISMQFYDVNGQPVSKQVILHPDSFTYPIPELQRNVSYMCEMKICNYVVRQPVLCGKDEDTYERFATQRKLLSDNHPRTTEIDQLLFRLNFLLHHPTRYDGDWWWQFKISPLTYQLEHTFAHLDGTYGEYDTEGNILFVSYRSEIDDSIQRYILARPNHIDRSKPLPLVVIIRPNIENIHHFFSCPQLARQWAINQMQALSNKYNFLVTMPEMRTYLNEDLLPIAEEELKLAIKDIKRHYSVDTTRIFLHANCSGGYRALRIATDYPSMFHAIALYAPLYHREFSDQWSREHEPKNFINRLSGIPMFIQGDPLDSHSPYTLYKDLIVDCQKYSIPLIFSLKRNSGQYYNVVLVGEEAFDFFKKYRCYNFA